MRDFGTPVLPPVSNVQIGLSAYAFGHPAAHRSAAQPFVFEKSKTIQIVVRLYLAARVEVEGLGAFQPERSAGGGIEMPLDHFTSPGVKSSTRGGRISFL